MNAKRKRRGSLLRGGRRSKWRIKINGGSFNLPRGKRRERERERNCRRNEVFPTFKIAVL